MGKAELRLRDHKERPVIRVFGEEFVVRDISQYHGARSFEIEYTNMYSGPERALGYLELRALAEYFGTEKVDVDNVSEGGCETCDFGSRYGHEIQVCAPTKNWPLSLWPDGVMADVPEPIVPDSVLPPTEEPKPEQPKVVKLPITVEDIDKMFGAAENLGIIPPASSVRSDEAQAFADHLALIAKAGFDSQNNCDHCFGVDDTTVGILLAVIQTYPNSTMLTYDWLYCMLGFHVDFSVERASSKLQLIADYVVDGARADEFTAALAEARDTSLKYRGK
jgi:hypothetical protein